MRDAVDMPHRSRRERPPVLSTGSEQGGIKFVQVNGLQLLQPGRSEVRPHVKSEELLVSFKRL